MGRQEEIKARWEPTFAGYRDGISRDVAWLLDEVERLRGLLARLEWNRDGRCNGCNGFQRTDGHDSDCWVAAELPAQPAATER